MVARSAPAVITAAVAVALLHAPVAGADEVLDYEFGDPSKNIACSLKYWPPGTRGSDTALNTVQCWSAQQAWTGPRDTGGTLPCAPSGYTFMLRESGTPEVHCFNEFETSPTIYSVLEYGQSRTAGAIMCLSSPDPTGMTCTNTNSGNSFRISYDSFELR